MSFFLIDKISCSIYLFFSTGTSYEEMSLDDVMQFGYMELRYVIEWAKKVPCM